MDHNAKIRLLIKGDPDLLKGIATSIRSENYEQTIGQPGPATVRRQWVAERMIDMSTLEYEIGPVCLNELWTITENLLEALILSEKIFKRWTRIEEPL